MDDQDAALNPGPALALARTANLTPAPKMLGHVSLSGSLKDSSRPSSPGASSALTFTSALASVRSARREQAGNTDATEGDELPWGAVADEGNEDRTSTALAPLTTAEMHVDDEDDGLQTSEDHHSDMHSVAQPSATETDMGAEPPGAPSVSTPTAASRGSKRKNFGGGSEAALGDDDSVQGDSPLQTHTRQSFEPHLVQPLASDNPFMDNDDTATINTRMSGHSAISMAKRLQEYRYSGSKRVKQEFANLDDESSRNGSVFGSVQDGSRFSQSPARSSVDKNFGRSVTNQSSRQSLSRLSVASDRSSPLMQRTMVTPTQSTLETPNFESQASTRPGIARAAEWERAPDPRRVRFDRGDTGSLATSSAVGFEDSGFEGASSDTIVMAVTYKNRKVGAAYYSVESSKLYLMQDMEDDNHFEIIRLLEFQVAPSIIITSARSDDLLMSVINEQDEAQPRFEVEVRPSTDFLYQGARSRLLSLRIASDTLTTHARGGKHKHSKTEMLCYLESVVSLESREMVGCAGALLNYITKARLTGAIMEHGNMEVSSVEHFSLIQFMHINADAMWSLQIFQDAAHPNIHSKRSKEGLSLYGILNHTKTPLGRVLLKQWMMRPCMDITVIEERHAAVGFFLRPEIRYETDQLRACMTHIKNIPRIMARMRTHITIPEWEVLLKFAFHALKIHAMIHDFGAHHEIPLFQRVAETFTGDELKQIGHIITNMVDFDSSLSEARLVVKPHVDDELDEMKRTYHGLDDLLSQVAHDISATMSREFATSLNVIYFPQLGYLITVPLRVGMTEQKDFDIEGLIFQFCTSNTVYYKSDRMFELDETIGDIHSIIVDREIELMQRLQETILAYRGSLIQIAEVCAELDCILSLAEAARKYDYTRPEMTEESVLEIVKGRHPLQELSADVFVPNDTSMGPFGPRMILLTGANSSGKSVYLKQIALITLMAQIGSFVPAEHAVVGITDKILTRIHTRESVSRRQSSFMIDLNQVSNAIKSAGERSLVLLDEFGKGTDLTDGIGLYCAVLEHFAAAGQACPRVATATHFHEIHTHNLLRIPPSVLYECTMQIMETDGRDDGLTFLYRVMPGRSTLSWGVHCAALAGIPAPVLRRGQDASDKLAKGEPLLRESDSRDRAVQAACDEVAAAFLSMQLDESCEDTLDGLWRAVDKAGEAFDAV
ncbi:MutS protein msh5 [Geranomyces variabilis]|nr:MutS protein msh5 [Geranomyces variabilis]